MPTGETKTPGDDVAVSAADSLTVINAVKEYKAESEASRRDRMKKNKVNRDAYMERQDWSHKTKGQSREFLPKTAVAVEQFVGFAKRAMVQFGDYYDPIIGEDSKSPLSVDQIRALMECHLNNMMVADGKKGTFPIQLTDALKSGCLESLIILKVFGTMDVERKFTVEPGVSFLNEDTGEQEQDEDDLKTSEESVWRLRIDIIKQEDYYPDPSGRGLYEVHSSEHDLHYVIERAAEGVYDVAAVAKIVEDFEEKKAEQRSPQSLGQNEAKKPSFRKKVVLDEFWGTILDSSGKVVHKNVFATTANGKYLIRKPTPNPFWHQESPFVAVPLIRVPFSTWHKALMDSAVILNLAQNELFNLMFDGALSSVWGIKQLRVDDLEDPSQVSDGIAQGETLMVRSTVPYGQKVLEKVVEGEIPSDAMAIFELVNREFTGAALTNELKLGSLPSKNVLATEVVEASQSQAVTSDSIIADIEQMLISVVLRKVWLTILQNMDDTSSQETISAVGVETAFKLSSMSAAERFATFANVCSFKVHGLSAVLAKARDFQKMMALLQAVGQSPILMQAFFKKYSPNKVLSHLMKTLSINPFQMQRDEEELARIPEEVQGLKDFQALQNGGTGDGSGGGQGPGAQDTGEPQLPAEINQSANPMSGLT